VNTEIPLMSGYICGCPESVPCRCFAGSLELAVGTDEPLVQEAFIRRCIHCGVDLSTTIAVSTKAGFKANRASCFSCHKLSK
jgi:hypothetical protein